MARHIGINAYIVKFKRLRKHEGSIVFSRRGAFDAYAFVERYLDQRLNRIELLDAPTADAADANTESRALKVTRIEKHPGSGVLEGLVEVGEGGSESVIRDLRTRADVHHRRMHQADMPPYYFRFYFPEGQIKGLFLVQRAGRSSPRGALYVDLRRWFNALDITFDVVPVHERFILEKYLNGGMVNEVTLRAWKKPTDRRELLRRSKLGGIALQEGTELQVTLRPKTRRGELADRLARGLDRGQPVRGLVTVEGLPEADEAIVQVEREGLGKRRFSITRPDEGGISEDVTSEVTLRNGHPTWETIRAAARRVMDELAAEIYPG